MNPNAAPPAVSHAGRSGLVPHLLRARCMQQYVHNVEKILRSRSNPVMAVRSIAAIATVRQKPADNKTYKTEAGNVPASVYEDSLNLRPL